MKPVNLNQFRKAKARADNKARANANAMKFGRSKAEKGEANKAVTKYRNHIDGHKRDPENP